MAAAAWYFNGLLVRGIDPETGELLAESSPFNSASVIRALSIALDHLPGEGPAMPAKPLNNGKPWTPHEDAQLLKSYDAGMPNVDLERVHQRSPGSIASRLIKLGRLKDDGQYRKRGR
jgi:hypothetical protein